MAANDESVAPSMLYAYAAIKEGVPFLNGAPNLTTDMPAMEELAHTAGVPIGGKDFKTGQTLLKTVLAPMLKARMLGLQGWYSSFPHLITKDRTVPILRSSFGRACHDSAAASDERVCGDQTGTAGRCRARVVGGGASDAASGRPVPPATGRRTTLTTTAGSSRRHCRMPTAASRRTPLIGSDRRW